MVFSGTATTYGRGRAVVTAAGMRTEMGRIAGMLKHEEAPQAAILFDKFHVMQHLGRRSMTSASASMLPSECSSIIGANFSYFSAAAI